MAFRRRITPFAWPIRLPPNSTRGSSDDRHDARWLAEMLRLGVLPTGYIYPKERRGLRDLLRRRGRLVQVKTQGILALKTLYARELGIRVSQRHLYQLAQRLQPLELADPNVRQSAASLWRWIQTLYEEIQKIERVAAPQIRPEKQFQLLKTVLGVGPILGQSIWLETGDIARFPSVRHFASYARCVPSLHRSNARKKGVGNRKNGNKYLRWAFMEAASHALRYGLPRAFYQRKKAQTNAMSAWSALAHKLCRGSYYVMRDRVAFSPARLFA